MPTSGLRNENDLRDFGALEQDADLIMFVYRDEVYDPQTMDKGTAENHHIRQAAQWTGRYGKSTLSGRYYPF